MERSSRGLYVSFQKSPSLPLSIQRTACCHPVILVCLADPFLIIGQSGFSHHTESRGNHQPKLPVSISPAAIKAGKRGQRPALSGTKNVGAAAFMVQRPRFQASCDSLSLPGESLSGEFSVWPSLWPEQPWSGSTRGCSAFDAGAPPLFSWRLQRACGRFPRDARQNQPARSHSPA